VGGSIFYNKRFIGITSFLGYIARQARGTALNRKKCTLEMDNKNKAK
jgi:hypothetical protein